jgi:hypothetical protein
MKKTIPLILLLASLTAAPRDSHARQVRTSLFISAQVDQFCEWAGTDSPTTNIILQTDWSGPINHVNQMQFISHPVTLYTNGDAHISAQPSLNNGILTMGSQTLDTQYRLTGALASPDRSFKSAAEFFSATNIYTVTHQPGIGSYTLNLEVQMSSPPDAAADTGIYSCGIALTAAW